jgi:hypothetical protein
VLQVFGEIDGRHATFTEFLLDEVAVTQSAIQPIDCGLAHLRRSVGVMLMSGTR